MNRIWPHLNFRTMKTKTHLSFQTWRASMCLILHSSLLEMVLAISCLKVPLRSNCRYPFFYISVHNKSFRKILPISISYENQNSRFLDLYFREFTAANNFPCSSLGWKMDNNNWYCNSHHLTADRLAQLVERRTTEREDLGSSHRPDQHSGS